MSDLTIRDDDAAELVFCGILCLSMAHLVKQIDIVQVRFCVDKGLLQPRVDLQIGVCCMRK